MGVLTKKLKGSTIIEAITAMVIILTCLTVAMSAFTRMSRDFNDELRIEAELRLKTFAVESKRKRDYTEKELDFGNIILRRKSITLPLKSRLKELLIEAYTSSGSKMAVYKEVIIAE
ncbi:MAG: hypothetical protein Q8928_10375 [Bacteroidota bacterium]|nr:hypothetical protein [Bacteroidota bacterium]